jgi:hypothetical protein
MKGEEMLQKKEGDPGSENWDVFGVHPAQVAGWKMSGFDSFEAAMAQGDGFTPAFAVHYRRQLRATAGRWRGVGLDCADGLRWHRAAFVAKEATRWRALGVDVEVARERRARYGPTG